jgi:hypothetical protein
MCIYIYRKVANVSDLFRGFMFKLGFSKHIDLLKMLPSSRLLAAALRLALILVAEVW